MRKRRMLVRRRTSGTVEEWERGWELVMTSTDSVPAVMKEQPLFQDCLAIVEGAFADGNYIQFELAMNALIDMCAESDGEQ